MCHTLPRIGYKIPYNKTNSNKKNDFATDDKRNSRTEIYKTLWRNVWNL